MGSLGYGVYFGVTQKCAGYLQGLSAREAGHPPDNRVALHCEPTSPISFVITDSLKAVSYTAEQRRELTHLKTNGTGLFYQDTGEIFVPDTGISNVRVRQIAIPLNSDLLPHFTGDSLPAGLR